jgi:recombination protein RecA
LIRLGSGHILAVGSEEKAKMRAALESLLRARKLDGTLTAAPDAPPAPAERLAPLDRADLDTALGGGLRRGHLSEITGAPSSGRTTLVTQALAAAAARGEAVALVDTCDTFDPVSAAAHGLALRRLLWVRSGDADTSRALKAFSLILQAGSFGLVALDLADVPAPALRRFPLTTWMRVARIIEGSDTVALLIGRERIARSAGGVTIALDAPAPSNVEGSPAGWQGRDHRARVFTGVEPVPRVVRARG